MDLYLIRQWFSDHNTVGTLYIGTLWECYTLEDVVREPGVKIPKETAIPYGKYQVIIDFSNRFQRMMPHVLNVHMFEGIRIHAGNTDKDTEGCILLGKERGKDGVLRSRIAFNSFFDKLRQEKDDIWLSIDYYRGQHGNDNNRI